MKIQDNPRGALTGSTGQIVEQELWNAGLYTYNFKVGQGQAFTFPQIHAALTTLGPFIASIHFRGPARHFILIVGADQQQAAAKIYYHDPWRGAHMSMTLDAFNQVTDPTYKYYFIAAHLHNIDRQSMHNAGLVVDTGRRDG